MAPPPINWTSIFPYDGDTQRAFEELAFQIVDTIYSQQGRLIRVNDSGGGDGVEFFLEFPNGDQWGWQTKFFSEGRLSERSRYDQIRESLKKALEVHPRMTKWILCTPMNFTPKEQAWFDNSSDLSKKRPDPLLNVVPDGRQVELIHWGNAKFHGFLSEPLFSAKRFFFFGELHLDLDWFTKRYESLSAGIKDKFNPALHTESQVDHAIRRLLVDAKFAEYARDEITRANERLEAFEHSLQSLRREPFGDTRWEAARAEILGVAELLAPPLRAMQAAAAALYDRLAKGVPRPLAGIEWRTHLANAELSRHTLGEVVERVSPKYLRPLTSRRISSIPCARLSISLALLAMNLFVTKPRSGKSSKR